MTMALLANLTSYVPPVPVEPIFPNFAFCHPAYGVGLKRQDAMYTGGLLPYGTAPLRYSIIQDEEGGKAQLFQIPCAISFSGVSITVETASPVQVDSMILVPNDIRGMAAHLVNHCVGARGTGGFITKRIQGLVDYVTDPHSDLDAPSYPDSTAFITLTISSPQNAHMWPGDYDPAIAVFLRRVLGDVISRVPTPLHLEIANRMLRYSVQAERMKRMGTIPWWEFPPVEGNPGGVLDRILDDGQANMTKTQVARSSAKKRSRHLLYD